MNLRVEDLVYVLSGFFIFLLVIFFSIIYLAMRYRKKKVENDRMSKNFEQQLVSSRIAVQEETLQYVSREMHDNLGQIASLIRINLGTLRPEVPQKFNAKLQELRDLTAGLISDIKLLSTTLNTDKLTQLDLSQAVKLELEKIERTGLFGTRISIRGTEPNIYNDKKLIVFRMVQEMLNNTIKHSNGKNIEVIVEYLENLLILTVRDDGTGFDVETFWASSNNLGNGLLNLQGRAGALGGTYEITSQPMQGTTSTLRIPL